MTERARKLRLDLLLVERGLTESRSLAQRLILAGRVRVDGQECIRPGEMIPPGAALELEAPPRFVSRGGEKLEAALNRFGVTPEGKTCADAGSSTGGFTDCLLQHGARKVYAVDVGKGILAWSLRNDPRVAVLEGTNARMLTALPEPVDLATADVSFISLRLILPNIRNWLTPAGEAIALIKPQFEAGRGQVGKGGVVRDAAVHRRVLDEILAAAAGIGFTTAGLMVSPLKGPAGNVEFLARFRRASGPDADLANMIQQALEEAGRL